MVPAPTGNPLIRSPLMTPGTTIPAPATRTGPVITTEPANTRPALPFGSSVSPPPVTTPLSPGSSGFSTPVPSGPAPAPFNPGNFGPPAPGAFRPVIEDPYTQPLNGVPSTTAPPMLAPPAPSGSQIMGSGYSQDRTQLAPQNQRPTINEPGFVTPPSTVQPLRDPHGDERIQNNNRAPQLLTPGDRTAGNAHRWAVIPAVWPVKNAEVQPAAKNVEPLVPVAAPQLDDSGWKSAR